MPQVLRQVSCQPISNSVDRRLGAVVRDMRSRRNMTQEGLGWQLGLSAAAVSRLEAGKHAVPLRFLPVLARALSIPIRDLLPPEWLSEG